MPVPKELAQGETVEIRCELVREGEFDGAVYTIRYFQYDGGGHVEAGQRLGVAAQRPLPAGEWEVPPVLHFGVRRVAKPDHYGGRQLRQCLRVGEASPCLTP